MSDVLKHECGIAMIRLLKPLDYYKEKYGSEEYGLNKLYLLMEKQHNRGQEAAGIGCVRLNTPPGEEYIYRERAIGSEAISTIFANVHRELAQYHREESSSFTHNDYPPYIGEVYMGHLRYSTTGRSGMKYVHPFLRRNNWCARNLLLCGNFNLTNVEDILESLKSTGQHPRLNSDTFLLLEQLGHALDMENERLFREFKDSGMAGLQLSHNIEKDLKPDNILTRCAPTWDGGFVICGIIGNGDMWAIRDSNGIRPAFYYIDDEIVVVASERPVIQTTFDVKIEDVKELMPGEAIIVDRSGEVKLQQILRKKNNARCSFERIYFSRGSDSEIYKERKKLGEELVGQTLRAIDYNTDKTVFSFIPNTAEVAFYGMLEGLEKYLEKSKIDEIKQLAKISNLSEDKLSAILRKKIRIEKVAIKDIKLRTFIAEGASRDDLATHVYDITYGSLNPGDYLVVIDDSIVRGTTLRQSILRILDRLEPYKIVVVSSSPQVRYPDFYGIDMSHLEEFIAFKAAVSLLKKRGLEKVLEEVYENCKWQEELPAEQRTNCVKPIYQPFTDEEIAQAIAELLRPDGLKAKLEIVYQTVFNLHKAIPEHPGDWYFTGNYPTPGGNTLVNRAYLSFYSNMNRVPFYKLK